jgi:hypothetical protein
MWRPGCGRRIAARTRVHGAAVSLFLKGKEDPDKFRSTLSSFVTVDLGKGAGTWVVVGEGMAQYAVAVLSFLVPVLLEPEHPKATAHVASEYAITAPSILRGAQQILPPVVFDAVQRADTVYCAADTAEAAKIKQALLGVPREARAAPYDGASDGVPRDEG